MNKQSKKGKNAGSLNPFGGLGEETRRAILGITFLVLGVFFILAFFRAAGAAGKLTYNWLSSLVGIGYFLVPALLVVLGISTLKALKEKFSPLKIAAGGVFLLSALGIADISSGKGGAIGEIISLPLLRLFDLYASIIILFAVLFISLIVIFDARLNLDLKSLALWRKKKKLIVIGGTDESAEGAESSEGGAVNAEAEPLTAENIASAEPAKKNKVEEPADIEAEGENFEPASRRRVNYRAFVPVPLELLEGDRGKPGVGDIKANANIIKRTLQNFGIEVEMDEISIGPSVTRYALKPAEGVKLSRIVALNNDLSLALAAHPIRIEAPIPGKSLVGIEIPNTVKTTVGLATLLAAEEFQGSTKPLLVSLGKNIVGRARFGDLAKMPHLLIAGATGSGKSVCIHAVITSLLYRNSPENLKFILIDPKRVELTLYNKIPHLLTPVITDAKKAILALKWAAREMERRYDILEKNSVRDIHSYHRNILEPALKISKGRWGESGVEAELLDTMPYIAIIIDELADIMAAYPRELEAAVVRLAQMSRATGIHLILSTQRPSVNVITGLIKANIPSRIALQVASQFDSRTILDASGAEKLLGAGDMLYLSAEMSKPERLQGPFISETEVKNVVRFLRKAYEDAIPSELNLTETVNEGIFAGSVESDDDFSDEDPLYEEAAKEVIRAGKASTSYLQRKFRVGYARAARLIDMLEERGIIGPGEGAKPREVIGARPAASDPEENSVL